MWFKLTTPDKETILINSDHIEAVIPNENGNTAMCLANQNQSYYVNETPEEIWSLMAANKGWN